MSNFSKPDFSHPPAGKPSSKNMVTGTIAWIVIILCALTLFISRRSEKQAEITKADPFKISSEFDLTASGLLGMRSLSEKTTITAKVADLQLSKIAKTDGELIARAIVQREMGDKEKAEELLKLAETRGDEQRKVVESTRRLLDATENDFDLAIVHEKIGWFGDLAAAQTRPPNDILRERFDARNRRIATANIGLSILLIGAGIVGVALLIIGIVLLSRGKLTSVGLGDVTPSAPFVESFAIYLALLTALNIVMSQGLVPADSPGLMIVLLGTTLIFTVAAIYWTKLRGVSPDTVRLAFGAYPGRGAWKEIVMGIAGYLALLPILVIGIALSIWLKNLTGEDPSHPIQKMMGGKLEMVILAFFLGVVLAPITEELMFRGALFAHLRKWMPWGAAAAIVAILFAAIHPQGAIGLPALACIGFNLAVIRYWRGSSIANISAHALNNAFLLSFLTLISQ